MFLSKTDSLDNSVFIKLKVMMILLADYYYNVRHFVIKYKEFRI